MSEKRLTALCAAVVAGSASGIMFYLMNSWPATETRHALVWAVFACAVSSCVAAIWVARPVAILCAPLIAVSFFQVRQGASLSFDFQQALAWGFVILTLLFVVVAFWPAKKEES